MKFQVVLSLAVASQAAPQLLYRGYGNFISLRILLLAGPLGAALYVQG